MCPKSTCTEHRRTHILEHGDGKRVAQTINGVITYFVGNFYEQTAGVVTTYYFSGGTRVAERKAGTLYYLLGDHLGSTALTTSANGTVISELRYNAWGEVRYTWGSTPTDYTYTGQYSYQSGFGLYFYNARFYDPALGHFAAADSLVPGGVQGLDRYACVNNNPVRYSDPSGHKACDEFDADGRCITEDDPHEIVIPFDTDDLVDDIPGTAEQWAKGALFLDEVALTYDTLLGIYVLVWTGRGLAGGLMFEGNPVTGAVGAAAGYIIGEGSVFLSGALFPGNLVASGATFAGLVSDIKSGNTGIQGSLSVFPDSSVNLTASGQVSSGALTSVGLSALGWAANIVTLSLPMQAAAVANDRGWFPSISIPVSLNLTFP